MDWDPHPGQLVVCVDDDYQNELGIKEIVLGHVYTIRAVTDPDELFAVLCGRPLDEPGVMLVEVHRPSSPDLGETPFGAYRFKPVDDKRLEVFRKAQAPTDEVPA
ncbi:hypothetical protein [Aminobacter aminovorans]|uniref:CheY-like chemotaxis protein n=1 Tax=Aminobacter aminovorans TaxID=83263 RepID=A0AAC9AR28_AMIAI|nr:hypothetical protein [Aminobacter aminovorans]AMS41192.1 hypothetical protein AA2016_2264 [Aminobacter aminovorans]MBB3705825.1 CheY-like chemotaxis protein [Aminobacter aminovorans]